ncbi:MAG: gamma-glutamyl-gamma-aminobutyrate hydrolase family protein [Rickettsiaceae bacterium]|nr:gamma-glutamyl-gamma-aminobutyrate hydrolase family protein [Rickettsiaceae bacterium]
MLDKDNLYDQQEFIDQLLYLTPDNISKIDFSLIQKDDNKNIYLLLDILMTWEEKDILLRNQIIKDNIPTNRLFCYLEDKLSHRVNNNYYADAPLINQHISISPECILSLYKDNLITQEGLFELISYFIDDDMGPTILSTSHLELVKELNFLNRLYLTNDFLKKYITNHNEISLHNALTLQNIITTDSVNLNQAYLFCYQTCNYLIKLITDEKLQFYCDKLYLQLKNGQDISTLTDNDSNYNYTDIINIALIKSQHELVDVLLKFDPQLLYISNASNVSVAEFVAYAIVLNLSNNSLIEVLIDNYYDNIQIQSESNFFDLSTLIFYAFDKAIQLKIIHKTHNPLFALIKENNGVTASLFNDNKTHILIANDEGLWANTLTLLSHILKNNFPDVVFHLITKEVWDKSDEEFLAKFNGFILPPAKDKYPAKSPFNLSDMGEENFLSINALSVNMLQFAKQHDIPTLGSCGGAQATVLATGGSLMKIKNLNHEALPIELKSGTVPYFMSLPSALQESILKGENNNYPKSIKLKVDIHCNFVAVPSELGINTKLAATPVYSPEIDMYPMSYWNDLMFATQYHPENNYLEDSAQQNWINNFINFARIHREYGGEYLLGHIHHIENNLYNLFVKVDSDETVNLIGDHIAGNKYDDCALAA